MDHLLRSTPGNVQWGLWDGGLQPVPPDRLPAIV